MEYPGCEVVDGPWSGDYADDLRKEVWNLFYELTVERHRRGATVITSNRDPSEFLAQFADPLLAQSAVDRIQSAAYELVIEGESYRKRQRPQMESSSAHPETPKSGRRPAS